jgi:hypothetical protein
MSVGELRAVMDRLPDDLPVVALWDGHHFPLHEAGRQPVHMTGPDPRHRDDVLLLDVESWGIGYKQPTDEPDEG